MTPDLMTPVSRRQDGGKPDGPVRVNGQGQDSATAWRSARRTRQTRNGIVL